MSAHLQYYRSQEGLGGRVTGQLVRSWHPYVYFDDAACLRIDYMDVDTWSFYRIVACSLAFDADGEEVTLTIITTNTYDTMDYTSAATAIAEDETVTLTTTDRKYSVTVTRVAAGNTGTMYFRPVLVQNNDIGHSDQEDPSGVVSYRCVYLYNAHTAAITISKIICDSGWKVSLEAASAETTQTIADENTAPTGPVFAQTPAPAQSIGAGEFVPLWIERTVDSDPGEHKGRIRIIYTTGGNTYDGYLCGAYVTSDTGLTDYVIYIGYDEAGNGVTVDTHTPGNEVEAATLPATVDAAAIQEIIHGLGIDTFTMRLGVRRRMQTGAESQNQLLDYAIRLDYTSGDITTPPAPTIDSVTFLDGGQVKAVVSYNQTDAVRRAVKLEATCGSETLTAYLPTDIDADDVDFVFQAPVTWGSSVTVSVISVAADGTESTADTDNSTAYFVYDGQNGNTFPAAATGAETTHDDEYISESFGDVDITTSPGLTTIECDGTLVFDARSTPTARHRITTLQLTGGTITGGSCSDPIDPVDATEFYLCAGGSRVAHVDLDANTFTCPVFTIENAIDCPVEGPYCEYDDVVYWQYYNLTSNRWTTFMAVDLTNTCVRFFQNIDCEA